MLHVFFGLIFVGIGAWALSGNWWAFLDLFRVFLPFIIVCLGITMILAGIRGKPKTIKGEE